MENKFKEVDKENFIEFLNFIAQRAEFNNMTVSDNIKFFKLLTKMQKEILPKINDNILEVIAVHENKKAGE